MAATQVFYSGNASLTDFTVTFDYEQQSDVDVYVDGTLQTITTHYSFLTATTIRFVTAPPTGVNNVRFVRTTDPSPQVDFTDGAGLPGDDLDRAVQQSLQIAEENQNDIAVLQGVTVNVRDHGAVGDGATDDTAAFNRAIASLGAATVGKIFIPYSASSYVVDIPSLTFGNRLIFFDMEPGTQTTDMDGSGYVFPSGYAGSAVTHNVSPSAGEQVDAYRVHGRNLSVGQGKFFAFNFQLESFGTSAEPEGIRGLVGTVTNKAPGTGIIKAINVGAIDDGGSAETVDAIDGAVTPGASTTNSAVFRGVLRSAGAADTANAIEFQSEGPRWKNGIVFEQGDEFEDAVLQASMDTGSAANALFLKLKNAAATVLFQVAKSGVAMVQQLFIGSTSGPVIYSDNGPPVAVVTDGSLYLQQDGGAAGSLWVRENGAWVHVGSAT